MPYDWRLAMPNLELRDAYFSRLKTACELHTQLSGLRVVLMSHSYGSTLVQVGGRAGQGGVGWGGAVRCREGASAGICCGALLPGLWWPWLVRSAPRW
jgi:hypothetical protein